MTPSQDQSVPYGFCHCGCGQKTKATKQTRSSRGTTRGEAARYITGHSSRDKSKNIPNGRNSSRKIQYKVTCKKCGRRPMSFGAAQCSICRYSAIKDAATAKSEALIIDGIPCRSIPLTKGYVAWVDEARFEDVAQWKWQANVQPRTVYAYRSLSAQERRDCGKAKLKLHRYLKGDPDGFVVDHRDGNGLHNWDANLRVATNSQNGSNAKRRGTKLPLGVTFCSLTKKYASRIGLDGRTIFIGSYDSPEEAGEAYRQRALELHGEFSILARKE